jgi:hypothetical protein
VRVVSAWLLASSVGVGLASGVAGHGGGASLVVEPETVQPGGTVTVRGDNLGSDADVDLAVVGSAASSFLGTFVADGEGDLQASVTIPATMPEGESRLEAHLGSQVVSASLLVAGAPIDDGTQGGLDQGDPLLVPLPADWNAPGIPTPSGVTVAQVLSPPAPSSGPWELVALVCGVGLAAGLAIAVSRRSR